VIKKVSCARSSVRTLIYLGIAYTTEENNFALGLFFPARGGWEEQWASLYSEAGNASPPQGVSASDRAHLQGLAPSCSRWLEDGSGRDDFLWHPLSWDIDSWLLTFVRMVAVLSL